MPVNQEVEDIKHGLSAQRFIYRITELDEEGESIGTERTTDQVVSEGIDGSPEGEALGSPGDLRIRRDVPQIWIKGSGIRTVDGWELLGGSAESFGDPIAVRGSDNLIGSSTLFSRSDHEHRLEVEGADDGVFRGARPLLNFTGSGVVVADDDPGDEVDIAISSTGYVEQIDVDPTDVTVIATTTLTSIYSVSLPAGSMGLDRVVRVRIVGDYINNTGFGRGLTIQISLGATVLYRGITSSNAIVASGIRRGSFLDFYLVNRDDADLQIGGGRFFVGAADTPTVGIGGMVALETDNRAAAEFETIEGALDTSLVQTLDVSVTHSFSSILLEYRKRMAFTDLARL